MSLWNLPQTDRIFFNLRCLLAAVKSIPWEQGCQALESWCSKRPLWVQRGLQFFSFGLQVPRVRPFFRLHRNGGRFATNNESPVALFVPELRSFIQWPLTAYGRFPKRILPRNGSNRIFANQPHLSYGKRVNWVHSDQPAHPYFWVSVKKWMLHFVPLWP